MASTLPELRMAPDEVESRFEQLQRKLVPMWEMIGRTDPGGPIEAENTIVVVPSLTVDHRSPVRSSRPMKSASCSCCSPCASRSFG